MDAASVRSSVNHVNQHLQTRSIPARFEAPGSAIPAPMDYVLVLRFRRTSVGSAMSLLIRNGRIITAVDDYHADLFIEGERVSVIGSTLQMQADTVIDAKGKYLFPGGVDPHTHLDMPFGGTTSADDFETGTRAAAHGGTTTLIDFAIQTKGQSTLQALETWHAKAEGKTAIDYGFHMIITDMEDSRLKEMKRLADEGVTSYKLFMAYPGVLYVDDGTIFRAMRKAGEDGTVVCMHAENGIVIDEIVKRALAEGKTSPKFHALTRPTRMEAEGTHRAIAIAEVAGGRQQHEAGVRDLLLHHAHGSQRRILVAADQERRRGDQRELIGDVVHL